MLTLVIFIILIALVFDFINGFHDAANSIATVVSTRVLTPRFAVMWAAFFNFIAAFGFGTHVATTMGSGMIQLDVVNEYVILAGLIGAILWDLITWYFALPTSSSHALMGGYAGAAIARAGFSAIVAGGWIKTLTFIVLSPIIGGILGFSLMVVVFRVFRNFLPSSVDKYFGKLQLVSAGFYSLGHGTNDAQKTMGIIAGLLFTSGYLSAFTIPFWVVLIAMPPWPWGPWRVAGESSGRWGRRSPSLSRLADFAPRRLALSPC
jgi:PiT family inorganic phosphate transporter